MMLARSRSSFAGAMLWGMVACSPMAVDTGATSRPMYADQIGVQSTIPENAPSLSRLFWRLPDGGRGREGRNEHLGIDISAPLGTPVLAAAPGRVIRSWRDAFYGNQIIVANGPGPDGRAMRTWYKHLSARTVVEGDTVARGQAIGAMGYSGAFANGVLHLHFEVLAQLASGRWVQRDPGLFWAGGVGRATCFEPGASAPAGFATTYPVACR